MSENDPPAAGRLPGAGGPARDPSRTRSAKRRAPETGRRHHIGEVPNVVTVFKPDGTVTTTRTSLLQLRDKTVAQLHRLAKSIESDMAKAADSLDFEAAAHLRDELEAVRREVGSR
jgi:excinuclease UvrABC helicase subunit UvrB